MVLWHFHMAESIFSRMFQQLTALEARDSVAFQVRVQICFMTNIK